MWYTYSAFIIFLISALLGYFVNYRQIVLTADQKEYKITLNVQGLKVIKVLLQTVVIYYLSNGYIFWLALEFMVSVVTAILLHKLLKKEYPWLKTIVHNGSNCDRSILKLSVKQSKFFFIKSVLSFSIKPAP